MKVASLLCLAILSVSSAANAGIPCADVKYGNQKYQDSMELLAKQLGSADGTYTRYQEDVVSAICSGKKGPIKIVIDNGFVTAKEVAAMRKILVKSEISEVGKSYGYSQKKFSDMGLCSACADNVAQYYTRKPSSQCGKLAKQALEGNPEAITELQSFPSYCTWQY